MVNRNRTPSEYIGYGLYLYFSGLSLRKASERLSQLYKRNHVAICNLELDSKVSTPEIESNKKKNSRVRCRWDNVKGRVRIHLALGCNRTWKQTNSCTIFIKRKKHVCCWKISFWFGQSLWKASSLYRDGGTWYPMACQFLKLDHHIHSSLEKSLIEIERYSISRTEPNSLTTTSLASWRIAN